jgi:hypothetical protein
MVCHQCCTQWRAVIPRPTESCVCTRLCQLVCVWEGVMVVRLRLHMCMSQYVPNPSPACVVVRARVRSHSPLLPLGCKAAGSTSASLRPCPALGLWPRTPRQLVCPSAARAATRWTSMRMRQVCTSFPNRMRRIHTHLTRAAPPPRRGVSRLPRPLAVSSFRILLFPPPFLPALVALVLFHCRPARLNGPCHALPSTV